MTLQYTTSSRQTSFKNVEQFYTVYDCLTTKYKRNLLCLHGSGVAGELTYGGIIPNLAHWNTVVVPDLRGMGQTKYKDNNEYAFSVDQLVSDMEAILNELGWNHFDICGYSLGGFVAMKLKERLGKRIQNTILIEPALLDNQDFLQTKHFRQEYKKVARNILAGDSADKAITQFLDLVSPNRNQHQKSEHLTIKRLSHRLKGFAYALMAIAEATDSLDRPALLAAQDNVISISGSNSYQPMLDYHEWLAVNMQHWRHIIIKGADHSLPYQKPRRLAEAMNNAYAGNT